MIPFVSKGTLIDAATQNELIGQVNENSERIDGLGTVDPDYIREQIDTSLTTHVVNEKPHPAYDDMPSLTVLFENGLV